VVGHLGSRGLLLLVFTEFVLSAESTTAEKVKHAEDFCKKKIGGLKCKSTVIDWTSAFWKIFNAYWHGIVKPLQYFCSCLTVSIFYPQRNYNFGRKCCVVEI